MNVKISDENTLFKISESELGTLLEGANIESRLSIGGTILKIMIVLCDVTGGPGLNLSNYQAETYLVLRLTFEELQTLINMGRDRDGIVLQSAPTVVRLQVDLRNDTRPRKVS